MKQTIRVFLVLMSFAVLAENPVAPNEALAGCGGCGGHGGGGGYGYGGAVNPAGRGYRGVGRYPLVPFATPLRPWGGITPVRQFLFGRGRIRRMNRRAFRSGGRCCF